MDEAKTVTIEYAIHPQENGYWTAREQKGADLTHEEALCILKYEMFSVAGNAMLTARTAGIPLEIAAFAMKEIMVKGVDEAVKRALEHIKNPGTCV
jgi:hypothetical protein